MAAQNETRRLRKKDGAPDRKMNVQEARMPLMEERGLSGKKDEGSGRQKNGRPRKMGAREAKKPDGKAKRPSGSQKIGRDEKNGRGEPANRVFALRRARGMAGERSLSGDVA